jgi:hypothetical protein
VLKTDEVQTVFFQVCIEAAVEAACYGSWDKKYEGSISHKPRLNGRPIEALARLMVVLVRMAGMILGAITDLCLIFDHSLKDVTLNRPIKQQ